MSLRVKVILISVFLCLALGIAMFAVETYQDFRTFGAGLSHGASLDIVGDLLSGISALLIGLLVIIIQTFYLLKLLSRAATKRAKQAKTSTSTAVDRVATRGRYGTLLP